MITLPMETKQNFYRAYPHRQNEFCSIPVLECLYLQIQIYGIFGSG